MNLNSYRSCQYATGLVQRFATGTSGRNGVLLEKSRASKVYILDDFLCNQPALIAFVFTTDLMTTVFCRFSCRGLSCP